MFTNTDDTLIQGHCNAADDDYRVELELVVHGMADALALEAAATGDEVVRREWIAAEVLRAALAQGVEELEKAWLAEVLREGVANGPMRHCISKGRRP